MVQNTQAREDGVEVVFHEVRIAGRDQWQHLGAGVSHVGCGIEPVLEKEKETKGEAGGLAFREKISRQKERYKPLQQRPPPQHDRVTEPAKQIMAALVNDEIGAVNEEKSAVS